MKKIIALLLVFLSLLVLSGCQNSQKEPSLADQIKESQKKVEESKKRLEEAKEEERKLENAVNTLKTLKENAGQ